MIELRDVTLRDGLQLTGGLLPTDYKVDLIRNLFALGFQDLEVGSLARPDLVPPMANTVEVVEALSDEERTRCWIWTATPGHVARAIDLGVSKIQYCFSVSETHNRENVGRSVDTSMDGFADSLEQARQAGAVIQLCLATSFTCPFEGRIDPDAVLRLVEDLRAQGADYIVLADTLGQANPAEVSGLTSRVRERVPEETRIGFHGHDTWGLGVANTLAAIDSGATMVDSTLAGLGGCPFAPGASGNVATEDLLFALRPDWLTPDRFLSAVRLGADLIAKLDEPQRSDAARASTIGSAIFEWAVTAPEPA